MQRVHHQTKMPDVFRQLQELDERRVAAIRSYLHQAVSIERDRQAIKDACLEGILKAADSINQVQVSFTLFCAADNAPYARKGWDRSFEALSLSRFWDFSPNRLIWSSGVAQDNKICRVLVLLTYCKSNIDQLYSQDSQAVIERFKSGNSPPVDIPFEDLSNSVSRTDGAPHNDSLVHNNSSNGKIVGGLQSLKGTISGKKAFKRPRQGLKDLFGGGKTKVCPRLCMSYLKSGRLSRYWWSDSLRKNRDV